jgi:AcrR family transcriptional regulator
LADLSAEGGRLSLVIIIWLSDKVNEINVGSGAKPLPRRYRLGLRAEQKSETRASIIRATLELIRSGGLRSATVPAIARAADVAPATVRNHFPDRPDLLLEVGDLILQDIALPDVDIFDGLDSPVERVTRLAHELVAFYGRSQEWWFIVTGDPGMSVAFERASAMYEARFDRLVREAAGPIADDPVVVSIVASVIGPPLHYALIGRGLTPDQVVESSLAMLVPWLEARTVKPPRRRSVAPPKRR